MKECKTSKKIKSNQNTEMIWGNLLHLSMNMWSDRDVSSWWKINEEDLHIVRAEPYLRFETKLWDELLRNMVDVGMNMVVIDVGDAVKYESHPEISVRKAWTVSRMKRELTKIRKMGLEPIPKLNFSTCHDAWLGPYSRCVSTDTYYAVCRDLIAEVIDIFDKPRFFHLGMDEENAGLQKQYLYAVIRQHELWWHDLYFYINEVEKGGVRSWIWSDYIWGHPDIFFKKMPKSVVQSNWYYGTSFSKKINAVKTYLDLEARGYDQIPTASNYGVPENFKKTVSYCKKRIAPERLLGFLQTPWRPTLETFRQDHLEAIELVGQALKKY
jgi:hypothetical protein